ncbi:MAG TPA: S41 family peptidase [Solirubrobacterales bacterium]|nr:S41 family peptidase [Solirubrobacterales bacterium]
MSLLRLLTGVLALAATFLAGIWLGGNPGKLPAELRTLLLDDTAVLSSEAASVIESNYFRPVSREELDDASVAGMVDSIRRRHDDRFSYYFDPVAVEHFDRAISGSFTGVGLSVVQVPRGLRVGRVFAGTPAEAAGITVSEVVVSVNGRNIAGIDATRVTNQIKGPEGTAVRLGVAPPDGGRPRQVRLTRSEIRLPPTHAGLREVDGVKLGYLQLATFSRGAHRYLRSAARRLQENGAEGILLDLRANGGGLLSEGILTASVFVDEGEVVVSTRSRSEGERVYEAVGNNLPPLPMTVLVNQDTASAAEILAAALSEDLGAPLVGTQTYGKGVFQKVIDLSNGGALDLTIGEYLTASGVSLAERGLVPEVRAEDDPETKVDEAMRRGLQVLGAEVRGGS